MNSARLGRKQATTYEPILAGSRTRRMLYHVLLAASVLLTALGLQRNVSAAMPHLHGVQSARIPSIVANGRSNRSAGTVGQATPSNSGIEYVYDQLGRLVTVVDRS